MILALIQREDVRLTKLAAQLPGRALQSSKVKQLHRFFKNIRLSEDVLARFVLSFAHPTERLWLVIDRTNWRLGKTEINILLVAVILNGQALPLMWTLLPHGGSSSSAVRNALLERVLLVLPAKRIAGLLGDREFIGKKWFKFLNKAKVAPCIRLKTNTKVGGIPVWALFKGIPTGEVRWWYRPLMVYGVPLRVCAVRDVHGHLLYVATLEHGRNALERYSRRWTIESLFKHWKGSAFDLEATHLTHTERLGTLLALITLTSVWAWQVGQAEHERAPIRVLAHGRLALSIVRHGLNTVKAALVNVLWDPSETVFIRDFLACAGKLSPT
ncbi:IS4 family transposase [Deinococcus altitudinis]|uniref:IS4 family transposase n=1 Tax=Deinococcus altitudinis TaxID=468914 RepID=UPI003891F6FC